MRTGIEDYFVRKNNQKLAFGFTTGTCAAAAAQGAARLLLTGEPVESVSILTPKGIRLQLPLRENRQDGERAICSVIKYAGDDPDVTDGIEIFASVEKISGNGLEIDGGVGVGRVTKPGLDQPVGNAAINRVPRQMITETVGDVRRELHYAGGLRVVISIPAGEALAAKTFNPRLGIVGGISVLGTSGIVEPMSEAALVATIAAEVRMRAAAGDHYLLAAPGNYGMDFLRDGRELSPERAVKCSNYVGQTIDLAVENGFQGLLFVSHIGKFVKVAGGIMNTHSREADSRLEILMAHGAMAGAGGEVLQRIWKSATTEDALDVLEAAGVLEPVIHSLLEKIERYCSHRCYGQIPIGAVLFSSRRGELGRSARAGELAEKIREEGLRAGKAREKSAQPDQARGAVLET